MSMIEQYLNEVMCGYVESILWLESVDIEDDYTKLGDYIGVDDVLNNIHTEKELREFITEFMESVGDDFKLYLDNYPADWFGHDLYLTRNGHGAGFWDRGLGELGVRLTKSAKVYGDINPFIDDYGVLRDFV